MAAIHRVCRTTLLLLAAGVGARAFAGGADAAAPVASGVEMPFVFKPDATRLDCFHPQYPKAAMRAAAQGSTVLTISLDATGTLTRVVLDQSAGDTPAHKLLDRAAVASLETCPFRPALGDDKRPIAWTGPVTFTWRME